VITFLSDYGHADDFVGVCHAVMASIAPQTRVIDITHGIERHDVRSAALALRNALPYCPAGVHVAVVDPGVGSHRRAVALRTADDRLLVGPDNGVLWLAAERFGAAVEAVDIGRSPWRLEPVSATFHGRDVFAPVAAHLAAGRSLGAAGEPIDPATLQTITLPQPRLHDGALLAHAVACDRFGNVGLDATAEELSASGLRPGQPCEIESGGQRFRARYGTTFADAPAGEILLYEDAYRSLAVAINRGSAAEGLGLARDDELRIRPS
jgi:S-adenosyl-L-methionine hydrolase (adenosine-forming)